ncbi:MAG: hypothetical protein EZS28_010210 [Streblomastix strix]|uniref:Uncharacterized protein n=1 Tax=Streblomastix strix TaxID=222440 RepID=A0A5J4WHU2_9EUKA|nr:MAG: hypothetical protein EZS28_010210 [Streblomastix strix]
MIYPISTQIVAFEQKSRFCYEDLMDDTADIILQHAEVYDEENIQNQNYSKSDNIAQATDPLIMNADSASSNIDSYIPRTNE